MSAADVRDALHRARAALNDVAVLARSPMHQCASCGDYNHVEPSSPTGEPTQADALRAAAALVEAHPDVPMEIRTVSAELAPHPSIVAQTLYGHSGDARALESLRTLARHYGVTPVNKYGRSGGGKGSVGPMIRFAFGDVDVEAYAHIDDDDVSPAAWAWIAEAAP